MTDNETEPEDSELPPISLPEGLQVQMRGFSEEIAQLAGNDIAAVARELSRHWPLNNLVGVTVAYEYDEALAGIDDGFEGRPPAQATHDDELGHGVAMAVSVNDGGVWKCHVVFGPYVVELIVSEEESDRNKGYKLVAHELGHAVDYEQKRRAFGDVWLGTVDELIPDVKEQYLWELSHFIWDEYFASRVSVGFDDEEEPYEDELFSNAYVTFRDRLRVARREYHWDEISLEEFLSVLKHNLRMVLLAAGYLFGLSDGKDRDLSEIAPRSSLLLEEDEGQAVMQFHAVLLKLWERQGEWTSYDEFLALNEPAEVLLGVLDLYVSATENGQAHIDIPPRTWHVYG